MSCSYAETRSLTFLVTTCFPLNGYSLSLWNILCWQQWPSASPPVLSVYCCHGWQVLTSASFTPCQHGFFSHSGEWFLKHQKEPDREDLKNAFEWSTHTPSEPNSLDIFFPWTVPSPNVWASALCHMVSFAYVSMSRRWFLLIFIVWTTQLYVLKLVNHRVVPPPLLLLQWVSKLMWINVFMSFLA